MSLGIEDARTLFDRRRTAWLAEDVDAYLDCWVDDLVLETPGRVVLGRAGYEQMVRGSFGWAAPRSFVVHHLAVDGVVVMADWTITVERRDNGESVTWRGMSVCELRDGRIVWWREYYEDPAALARAARR
ncbi:MAG TPA: nuclear transport factor 2 family protein [Acidimicrobiia bacterium]|nr:nuclear transport factor 2 family protein [Acidimicrobiia bacterium]